MGKRNAVFLTLSTFLGVVGRESRFVVNHRYDSLMMRDSKQDVADLLDEHEEKKSIQELLRKQQKPAAKKIETARARTMSLCQCLPHKNKLLVGEPKAELSL